jgi:hypothetical protein
MAEIGIDRYHVLPEPLTADVVQASDVVITKGCGDAWRRRGSEVCSPS